MNVLLKCLLCYSYPSSLLKFIYYRYIESLSYSIYRHVLHRQVLAILYFLTEIRKSSTLLDLNTTNHSSIIHTSSFELEVKYKFTLGAHKPKLNSPGSTADSVELHFIEICSAVSNMNHLDSSTGSLCKFAVSF
jgi:hypothetical protein